MYEFDSSPWEKVPIGELFELDTESCRPYENPDQEYLHHSLPAWDLGRGPILQPGRAIKSNKYLIRNPCILVSKLNPRMPRVTIVSDIKAPQPQCASTEFMIFVPKRDDVFVKFYGKLFASQAFHRQLERVAKGTTNSHVRVRPTETLRWKIPFVPVEEQRRIAEILDTADAAIQQTESVVAKLKQVKAGLLHDLLTRGLDENGQLRDPEAHPEEFKETEIGRMPREWKCVSLDDVTLKIADRDHTTPTYVSQGVYMVSPVNFVGSEGIDFDSCRQISAAAHQKNRQKTDIEAGDILLYRIGAGLGQVRLVTADMPPFSILHSLAMIRVDEGQLIPRYLLWALRTANLQEQMELGTQSIGVPDLGLGKIAKLRLPVPTLAEQERIVAVLEAHRARIQTEEAYRDKLQQVKRGLMQDLLTGRVRV